MSNPYKSYHFYDVDVEGSDKEQDIQKNKDPSKPTQRQEKKNIDRNARQKAMDSDSGSEENIAIQGFSDDSSEEEFTPKNKKKVKQDEQANKKKVQPAPRKGNNLQESSTSANNTPDLQDQKLATNTQRRTDKDKEAGIRETMTISPKVGNTQQVSQGIVKKGGLVSPLIPNNSFSLTQNTSFQGVTNTEIVEGNNSNNESFTEPMTELSFTSNANLQTINSLLGNMGNKQTGPANPANSLNPSGVTAGNVSKASSSMEIYESQGRDSLSFTQVTTTESVTLQADISNQMTSDVPTQAASQASREQFQRPQENRDADRNAKKRSGRFEDSSESKSSTPPKSPPKITTNIIPSAEGRQKKSIKKMLKSQPQEDSELGGPSAQSGNRPKFFVDTIPLGLIQTEGQEKKLIPQVGDGEQVERQYRIIGQERAFRTQEKNLLEKLNKFLVEKEDKEEEEKDKEEEVLKDEDDEFNFENRYFMYNPTKVCNRCKKPGHYERMCPEDVIIRCVFCVGHHRTDECPQVVCFKCYGVGHMARDCDAPGSLVCFRCGKRGHKSLNCGIMVLKESTLTKEKREESGDIKCMHCGRYGHPKCGRNTESRNKKKKREDDDGLYDENEREQDEKDELNLRVLSKAREIEKLEFEGASEESYEDLSNFEKPSKVYLDSRKKNRNEKEKERHREWERDYKRERKDRRDKDGKKKKSRRYYN